MYFGLDLMVTEGVPTTVKLVIVDGNWMMWMIKSIFTQGKEKQDKKNIGFRKEVTKWCAIQRFIYIAHGRSLVSAIVYVF